MLYNKGVYLVHPAAFRRCENCANFLRSEKCASLDIEVSENHTCRRFYSYKTILGGAFSPIRGVRDDKKKNNRNPPKR